MKSPVRLLLILAVIGGGLWLWLGRNKEPDAPLPTVSREALPADHPSEPEPSAPKPTPVAPPPAAAPANPRPVEHVLPPLPELEQIRREVGEDPHGTPPSLVAFATEVADRMEAAKGDREAEFKLLHELLACSVPNEQTRTAASVQAFCFSTAREISEEFPELKAELDTTESRMDREALNLLNALPN
jgi:hypothetical protein